MHCAHSKDLLLRKRVLLLRGTVLYRTYGTHKILYIYCAIFTDNSGSHSPCSPVILIFL